MPLQLNTRGDRVLVSVRVQPRASRTEVSGVIAATGALKIRLQAPPVDGAANKALLKFLGKKLLRVPPSSLEIVHGQTGRDKVIAVSGLSEEAIRDRLGDLAKE